MPSIEELTPLIEEKLASMGLELYAIKHHQAGRHSALRVFIDKTGGVSVADCEHASRALSMLLDVEEYSASTYNLEVSSPGLDRPLATEKDFKRAVGRSVTLQLHTPHEGKQTVAGTVKSCENGSVVLQVKQDTVTLPISQIKTGRIEVTFS